MSAKVVMATRDASWYQRPNVRSVKVYHVTDEDWRAVCSGALLIEWTASSVEAVHIGLRCRRRACMNRWVGVSSEGDPT